MANYDYLSMSIESPSESLIGYFLKTFDLTDCSPINPLNGYTHAVKIHRGDTVICKVSWGNTDGVTTNVRASGRQTPIVYEALQSYFSTNPVFYWVTRIDSCEDFSDEGLFDRMASKAIEYAQINNRKIDQKGDWVRGNGRTLYIGSRQSEVFIRIYEKGKKEGTDPNWVRYEVEIKPPSKDKARRHQVSNMPPGQLLFMGMSGKLLHHLGWDHLEVIKLGTIVTKTDTDRAREALCRQYGNIINGWVDEVGGWERFMGVLQDQISRVKGDDLAAPDRRSESVTLENLVQQVHT